MEGKKKKGEIHEDGGDSGQVGWLFSPAHKLSCHIVYFCHLHFYCYCPFVCFATLVALFFCVCVCVCVGVRGRIRQSLKNEGKPYWSPLCSCLLSVKSTNSIKIDCLMCKSGL